MDTISNEDLSVHQKMTEKRKAGYDKKQAKASKEKGLLIVNTGPGKGKTTAAFGMALRAVGHGMQVGVVQFIKGAMATAERDVFQRFDNVSFHSIGDGFTWNTQNKEQDIATAKRAWDKAASMLVDPKFDMIVLDELNHILKYEYLDIHAVLETIAKRRDDCHVIVTGRNAPQAVIDAADLVSEIRAIKHPYKDQGIKAQRGVEF